MLLSSLYCIYPSLIFSDRQSLFDCIIDRSFATFLLVINGFVISKVNSKQL